MLFHIPFFFSAPATTAIYTLSLHDALPICFRRVLEQLVKAWKERRGDVLASADELTKHLQHALAPELKPGEPVAALLRSEEHTSELQSHVNLVCRLLLEKKKN